MSANIAVLGGGLAGLSAARQLAREGHRPVVFESRRRLGGRASSFDDVQSGLQLDNCQHVLMGCCTHLLDFYQAIGVQDAIEWHDQTWWLRPGGMDVLSASFLPAPLHMSSAFASMRLLGWRSKRRIAEAMWNILRIGIDGRSQFAEWTFGSLLEQWGQDHTSRSLFWDPIIISACNLSTDDVAAVHGLQVMQEGFLAGPDHARMGGPKIPLGALYEPTSSVIERAGGEIRLGQAVTGLHVQDGQVTAVMTRDGRFDCDAVISALPWERLNAIVEDHHQASDRRLRHLSRLGHSPILGIHFQVPRPILDVPHLVLPGHDVQWLFNKGIDEHGAQRLHAVISAANEWMGASEEEIVGVVQDAVDVLCGGGVQCQHVRPVKERRATFCATPEAEAHRPAAAPGPHDLGGLILAGDWCATGWPATMEGAVRSGNAAAAVVTGCFDEIGSLPPGRLVRLLARGA